MYWSNYTFESNYLDMDLTAGNGKTYKYWRGTTPLYPFGYGISYTTFTFKQDTSCSSPQYCVTISNTGSREGYVWPGKRDGSTLSLIFVDCNDCFKQELR